MDSTRIIIIAGGDNTRWQNFMDIPKSMLPIFGKPLLQDIIDKFKSISDDIHITCKEKYNINGATQHEVKIIEENYDADKFLNNIHLWNKEGRTIIVYGDVYFSEYAISVILLNIPI